MGAKRILDISRDDLHLKAMRGFLLLCHEGEELARVALDQLDAIIVHSHGVTYSNNLMLKLLEHQCAIVLCGANHMPQGVLWGCDGHHKQAGRLDWQIEKTPRLKGRLWKQIVQGKIKMQAAVLERFAKDNVGALRSMSQRVKSGDSENVEAQAARRYWRSLMGEAFRRDQNGDGANGLLNYGYTVLRALICRQIYAVGLLPAIGLHHHNNYNPMRLADDLMEPFRPVVDSQVYELLQAGMLAVTPQSKTVLGKLGHTPLMCETGETDLVNAVEYMLNSLVRIYETGEGKLSLPEFSFGLS